MNFTIHNYSDMLRGSEDHVIGIIGDNIIVAGGFCSGIQEPQCPTILHNKVNKKTNHDRGFIKDIFCYSIKNNNWKCIGKLPIKARQLSGSIVLGNKMYIWGGFSYIPLTKKECEHYRNLKIPLPNKKKIYTYADGCCLSYENNILTWHNCPTLPFSNVGFKVVNYKKKKKIYFLNGSMYDRQSFNTFHCINNIQIGKMFFSMSYDDNFNIILGSLEYINNFPGLPRLKANVHVVEDYIYIFSGYATTKNEKNTFKGRVELTYHNIVDNWKYNILTDTWSRLKTFPTCLCNAGSVVYKDRYVIFIGGVKYNKTLIMRQNLLNSIIFNNDIKLPYNDISTIKNPFVTIESTANQYNHYFSNIIGIYDIIDNVYNISETKLPININSPIIDIHDSNIYIVGGEVNPILINNIYYGNCSSLLMKIIIGSTKRKN